MKKHLNKSADLVIGYYLYMESSAPAQPGSQAVLQSPQWLRAPKGGQCMKFFYTMYGKTMGSLIVKLQEFGKRAKNIFVKNGNQGVHWIGAKVSLDIPEGTKYQVKQSKLTAARLAKWKCS